MRGNSIYRAICVLGVLVWFCPQFLISADLHSKDPAERREAALEIARTKPANGIILLSKALEDDNMVVRRTAASCLKDYGKEAVPALNQALSNSDEMVCMIALTGLNEAGVLSAEMLAVAIKDSSSAVRSRAVDCLIGMTPRTKEIEDLLKQAAKDEAQVVRDKALNAGWSFHRKVTLLRDRADNIITIKDQIRLPSEGWKLKHDPAQIGQNEKWFDPKLNDADWAPVGIEKFWGDFGSNYTGVAWYRGKFQLPEKPAYDAVELAFEAVDESAWVWLNGQYVGEHDAGPNGWDQPFQLDAGEFLKWGGENQITVRVLNTAMAGGIWKPVTLQVLKINR